MSKIRTINDLQNVLDNDFSWRIKEIASLKNLVRKSDPMSQKTAVRAAIPLLYGHWEGFIKNASISYLEFVNNRGLTYLELKSCFVVFGVKKKINELITSKNSEVSIASLEFIRSEMNEKANLQIDHAIRTEFNLSSKVFANISCSIGIDISRYEIKFKLIDESLLNRRNHIAHGEFMDIEPHGFRGLADEILLILRSFKTDIENAVTLESYKT